MQLYRHILLLECLHLLLRSLRKKMHKCSSHWNVCSYKTLQVNMLYAWFINIAFPPPSYTPTVLGKKGQAEFPFAVMLHSSVCRLKARSKGDTGISLRFSLENQENRHKQTLETYEQAADVYHCRLPKCEHSGCNRVYLSLHPQKVIA